MTANEKKTLKKVAVAHTLVHLVEGTVPPLIPILLVVFGANYFELGLVVTVFSYALGLGALPAGILADRLGPKKLLLAYLFGVGVLCLLILPVGHLVPFAVIMGFLGLFCSLFHPAGNTMISLEIKERGRAFGINGIAGSLGTAGVPVLAAWLATLLGWKTPQVLFGCLALLIGFFALRLPSPRGHAAAAGDAPQAEEPKANTPLLVFFFVSCAFVGMGSRGTLTFLPTYLGQKVSLGLGFDKVTLGGIFATLTLASGAAGQYVSGRLTDRFRADILSAYTLFLSTVCLLLMAFSEGPLLMLAAVANAFFAFAIQPMQNTLIPKFLPKRRLGLGYGFMFFLGFGVGSVSAALSGYLADAYGLASVFLAMAGLTLLAFLAILGTIAMEKRKPA